MLCFCTLRKRVLVLVLLVVLAEFVISSFAFSTQLERFKENVLCFPLLGDCVLRFVLFVVIALVFFGHCNLVVQLRGIDHKVIDLCLFIPPLVFLLDIFVGYVHARGDETPEFVAEDFIRHSRLKIFYREIVLRQDRFITGTADKNSVLAEYWILEDLLFDFGGGYVQSEPSRLIDHDVLRNEVIEDLPLEMKRTHHLRRYLAPHTVDRCAIRSLEFPGTDGFTADGSDVSRNTNVGQVTSGNIEQYKAHTKNEDED